MLRPAGCVMSLFLTHILLYGMLVQRLVCRPPGCHLRLEVGSSKGRCRRPTCLICAGYNRVYTATAGLPYGQKEEAVPGGQPPLSALSAAGKPSIGRLQPPAPAAREPTAAQTSPHKEMFRFREKVFLLLSAAENHPACAAGSPAPQPGCDGLETPA